jgi:hypothetical protein
MAEPLNELARFNYLAGEVVALRCALSAFATVLRDNPKLAEEFEKATQAALVKIEKTRASNHAFDGFQSVVGPLRKRIEGREG